MRRVIRRSLATMTGGILLALAAWPGHAYRDRPELAHSGGFGEPSCVACHFGESDQALPAGDVLRLGGFPGQYMAGETYELTISLEDGALRAGGFEMTARFAGGGAQAGVFDPVSMRAEISEKNDVFYVHHTYDGTVPSDRGHIAWKIRWTAPAALNDTVIFNLVGNAANGDDSQFGDTIYRLEIPVKGSAS